MGVLIIGFLPYRREDSSGNVHRIGAFAAWIQYRYVLVVLGFFGLASVFAMRVNLSVAMVVMVNQSSIEAESPSLSCPVGLEVNNTATPHESKVSKCGRNMIFR